LSYQSHIKAMAAAQPFISGAISKTINMPNHATLAEISDAYLMSWKLMIKANALYRDGSKLSQPLNTISEDLSAFDEDDVDEASVTPEAVQHGIAARHAGTPEWEGVTRSGTIVDKNVRVVTREYDDGALGSVSMTMTNESPEYQGLLTAYSDLVSFAVQRGIPLSELVDSFTFADFPPGGPVYEDLAIKNATSPVDYLFRVLGHEYLGRQDLVHLKEVKPLRSAKASDGEQGAERGVRGAVKRKKISEQERKVLEARAKGYTGDKCPGCGSLRLKRNGTCALCEDCGATTGCS
jgi:ribonucleoside-diphosphate reductase alpha chain